MTIASAQTLRQLRPVEPFFERTKSFGLTFGVGPAGYDVRIAESLVMYPGSFLLASTVEKFTMPSNLLGVVHDKSTWARMGLFVQNTVIEPGWTGYLTLELTSHGLPHSGAPSWESIELKEGMPIAQIVFHLLDTSTDIPYDGKYQDQAAGPQAAKFEKH